MLETAPNNMLLQRIVVKHLRCCAAFTNFLPLLRGIITVTQGDRLSVV